MNYPTNRNIFLYPLADFLQTFNLGWTDANGAPLDLTSYTGVGSFREWYGSPSAVSFTVTGGTGSTVILGLPAAALANTDPGHYVYDAFLTSTANVTFKALEGSAIVDPTITHS